ncbi:MAG TPA: hypothetical protein PLP20_02520 [Oscillospiraceae bacterium]|nr:hypothetical protein [Oscillospiraceae bacterium]HNW03960.1 hypothetical protein [Oscillospiraceae bacterium]HPV99909.1 hypothetical protein [Oscillospiraceae bacterium]
MIEALNMKLEPIRSVLKNDVNEIAVCQDMNRPTDVFYTLVSVYSPSVRKKIAEKIGAEGLFASNSDFIGAFSRKDAYCMVFLYRNENRLSTHEDLYSKNFAHEKQMAENLLVACAETQASASVGILLLDERNVNVERDRSVYFNYFLDFKDWDPAADDARFYHALGERIFSMLARKFKPKFGEDVNAYPSELQVFYKKTENRDFRNYSSMLAFVKNLPDEPRELLTGWRKFAERLKDLYFWCKDHSTTIFIIGIVAITLFYLFYQIYVRWDANRSKLDNTSYAGMETVGSVFFGDEEI